MPTIKPRLNRYGVDYSCFIKITVNSIPNTFNNLWSWISKMSCSARCIPRICTNNSDITEFLKLNANLNDTEARDDIVVDKNDILVTICPINDFAKPNVASNQHCCGNNSFLSFVIHEIPTCSSTTVRFVSQFERFDCTACDIIPIFYFIYQPKKFMVAATVYDHKEPTNPYTFMDRHYYRCIVENCNIPPRDDDDDDDESRDAIYYAGKYSKLIDESSEPRASLLNQIRGVIKYASTFNVRQYLIQVLSSAIAIADRAYADYSGNRNVNLTTNRANQDPYNELIRNIIKNAIPYLKWNAVYNWYEWEKEHAPLAGSTRPDPRKPGQMPINTNYIRPLNIKL